jgi:nucleoside-diphosphate kinase
MIERTFVMLKPDAVKRGLIGEIISVFEKAGLKVIALKMVRPSKELATRHYPETTEWLSTVGEKTLEGYAAIGLNVKEALGTDDKIAIGKMVKGWLVEFLTSGDVVAMVLEGNAAVLNVRRICGKTVPLFADPGSIRGRYSLDSPDLANAERRPVYNLVHASGEPEEAQSEIQLWFPGL